MKVSTKVALIGVLTTVVVATQAFMCSDSSEVPRVALAPAGFAVVELFTSEGCSSCPPADQLVARVQQEDKGEPVYILAFHVDYWDRLGWKDAFSNAQYSRRQYQYATWLSLQSVYTPEVVVNGQKEFVGSDESSLHKAIDKGLGQPSSEQLTLSNIQQGDGKVDWNYQVGHAGQKQTLVVAVVQRTATTAVKAGENGGRTLSHVQIVRNLFSSGISAGGAGSGSLALPAGIRPAEEELIAFVQDDGDGKIVAATSSAIPQ